MSINPSPTRKWGDPKVFVNYQLAISDTTIPDALHDAWNGALTDLLERITDTATVKRFQSSVLSGCVQSDTGVLTFTITVSSAFIAQWVQLRYGSLLRQLVAQALDTHIDLILINFEALEIAQAPPATVTTRVVAKRPPADSAQPATALAKSIHIKPNLNRSYTFDTFVRGKANQLAASCAVAVSNAPGEIYNPFFVYGPSGNGKTHLLHAIGTAIQQRKPSLRVGYVSGESFLTEFLESLRENKTNLFRKKYRLLDVLLVDDIQFLGGREATVEEFFHTFNTLQQSGRALIIASDRAPRDLPGMDDRIKTRLSAGMVAQLAPPELELRIGILQNKLDRDNASHLVPLQILEYIAMAVTSSIRALEGALVRLLAMASVSGEAVSLSLAQDALMDIADNAPVAPVAVYGHTIRPIPPHHLIKVIQDVLEETLHVDRNALVGLRRDRQTVHARHIAMYLIRDLTGASLASIGDVFGGKDHTSVRHACEKVTRSMQLETVYMQQIIQLRQQVTLRLTTQSMMH